MRTKLVAELDLLLAIYINTGHKGEQLPSERFPHVFKLLEALKDIE